MDKEGSISYAKKPAKALSIGYTRFISKEVDLGRMEIRDALEDKEHRYTDNGEEICCPVCGAMWLQEEEGDFTTGTCEHLRFTLHSECEDRFEFFGEWNSDVFLELVEAIREKDEDMDILDILDKIQNPEANRAIFHQWQEDPLNHPWTLWGYKKS
jgi:hypothetical protein